MKRLQVAEGTDLKAILLSLFVVFHVLEWLAGAFSFSLPEHAPFAEDLATWENVRIKSRLDFFFYASLSGLLTLALLYTFWKAVFKRINPSRFTLAIIIASWIFILQLFGLFSNSQKEIISITEVFLLVSILIVPGKNNARISDFFLVAGSSFGLSYIIQIIFAYEYSILLKFETLFALTALLFVLGKKWLPVLSGKTATKTAVVLLLLPLMWIISTEFLLIANAREWYIKSPLLVFPFFASACILLFILKEKIVESYFNKTNYPFLFLLCILVPALYQVKYHYPCDPFELANPANAMMRSFEFGEMPLFSFFSSHVLSEQFPGWMYYLLHGYEHNLGFVSYNMFAAMTFYVLLYFAVNTILRSSVRAFFFVLLFPFAETLFPQSYALLIVSGLLTVALHRQFDSKRMYLLMSWSVFLMLWRLDLGIANLLSSLLLFASIWVGKGFRYHRKIVLRCLITFTVTLATVFVLVWIIYGSALVTNIERIWLYISAQQAHGLPLLSIRQNAVFYFHYFILPFAISMIGVMQIIRIAKGTSTTKEVFIAFLAAAYFFNIQRGLVRHSLYEGNDAFITSFGLFVLFVWLITEFKSTVFQSAAVISLLVIAFSHPSRTNEKALLSKWDYAITHPDYAGGMKKIERFTTENAACMDGISELKLFADEHFNKMSSFIDLSNQPMLYYFLQRPVPSYFNQALQNVVHPRLQNDYLKELNNYDVPFVVWNSQPELWFDQTDGIPNSMRYNLVREHVFKKYYPYKTIGGRSIWIRNDLKEKFGPMNLTAVPPVEFDLQNSPLIRAEKRKKETEKFIRIPADQQDTLLLETKASPQQMSELFLRFSNNTAEKHSVRIAYYTDSTYQGSFRFFVPPGENTLLLPVGVQARWRFASCNKILFNLPEEITILSYRYNTNTKVE